MSQFRVDYYGAGEYSGLDVIGTNVRLINDNDSVIFVRLKGDYTKKNKNEILNLALEQFYEETFPNRAENEKFRKFEGLISEGEKSIEKIKADFEKIKAENSTMQMALMSLLNKLAGSGDIASDPNDKPKGQNDNTNGDTAKGQNDKPNGDNIKGQNSNGVHSDVTSEQAGNAQNNKPSEGNANAETVKPNEGVASSGNGK